MHMLMHAHDAIAMPIATCHRLLLHAYRTSSIRYAIDGCCCFFNLLLQAPALPVLNLVPRYCCCIRTYSCMSSME